MNRIAFAIAALVFAVVPATAQVSTRATLTPVRPDYLIPEDSVLAGNESFWSLNYFDMIARIMSDGFDRDVEVRAVVLPSFSQEYVVGIRGAAPGQPTDYHVFYLRPKIHLWAFESLQGLENGLAAMKPGGASEKEIKAQTEEVARLKAALPAKAEDTPLERCDKSMDPVLVGRIKKVWIGVLRETHYPKHDSLGLDGVSFHFSAWDEYQPLAGKTWSPDKTSKPGMLAELAETLVQFCDGGATVQSLERQADALTKRLNP